MRSFLVVVCSLVLWGCESDVDLCGGGSVCGVDGNAYGSYCEAGAAGVDVAYAGGCNSECDPPCELPCQYGLRVEDGCPACECAPPPTCMSDDPCTRGDICVDGRCAQPPEDAGTDASFDTSTNVDAERPCSDTERLCGGFCKPIGTVDDCTDCGDVCDMSADHGFPVCNLEAGGCRIECDPDYGDCDDDGACELLDTPASCGACGNICPRFATCVFDEGRGSYGCECPGGLIPCGDKCINPDWDGEHCGGCPGTRCDSGSACRRGSCTDEGGDACTNPANWECVEGPDSCDVRCGDIFFYGGPGGSTTCTDGSGGALCTLPSVPNCASCIDVAARCCFGG